MRTRTKADTRQMSAADKERLGQFATMYSMYMKNFTLTIDKRLMRIAEQHSSDHCQIAEGLREQFGAWSVHVTQELIRFNVGNIRYSFPTPPAAAVKLTEWDELSDEEKDSFKPFKVYLRAELGSCRPVEERGPRDKPYNTRARQTSSGKPTTSTKKPADTTKTTTSTTKVAGPTAGRGKTSTGGPGRGRMSPGKTRRKPVARRTRRRWHGLRVIEKSASA